MRYLDCPPYGSKNVNAWIDNSRPSKALVDRYQKLLFDWPVLWPEVLLGVQSRVSKEEFGVTAEELFADKTTNYLLTVCDEDDHQEENWKFELTRTRGRTKLIVPLSFYNGDFTGGQAWEQEGAEGGTDERCTR